MISLLRLSKQALNICTEFASTTSLGREFHSDTTR